MQTKAGQRRKGEVCFILCLLASAVESRLLVHVGLATQTGYRDVGPKSGIATPSAPIAGSACLCLSNDNEHVCCHAALLCLWLQPIKFIGLHDGGQRYLMPFDCYIYKPTC